MGALKKVRRKLLASSSNSPLHYLGNPFRMQKHKRALHCAQNRLLQYGSSPGINAIINISSLINYFEIYPRSEL